MDHLIKRIDGRLVITFIWAFYSQIKGKPVVYAVEAFDKDHSHQRLKAEISASLPWEFIHQCEPDEFIGKRMAHYLELKVAGMQ